MPTDTKTSYVPFDIAVVVVNEVDPVAQPFALSTVPCIGKLLARDVERPNANTVLTSHMQRKRSPSASRLHDRFIGLQSELSADEVELRLLRGFKRHLWIFEIRAGVDEVPIEPQLIELIAAIVVMLHVAPRARERIRTFERSADTFAPRLRTERDPRQRLDDRHQVSTNVNPAFRVRIPESQV
jgi:hypothetical protein